jgi:Xaa-Pro aminopeptidase
VDARRDETASFRSLSFLRAELPDVEWTDFTDELHTIRAVKSDEEIAFLEHSAGIVDAAYVAALAAAHPGVNDYAVWAAVVEEICRHGSELPVRLRWIGDHQPGQMLSQPTLRRVEQGWLFLSRVEAAWGGYRARATLPFSCGEPAPPYPELVSLLVDIWNETCERIRAGISIARVQEVVAHSAAQHAPHRGPLAGVEISFALNGCGPGLDLPRIAGREVRTEDAQRVIAPGWCFALTLAATAGPHRLLWGDTVAVSDRGARRLGSAPQGIRIAS